MEVPVSFPSVNVQPAEKTAFAILIVISVCHLLNDMMQTLLSAIYPLLQTNYGLSFAQIGMITLTFQGTASILQPMVGFYIDRHPRPYSLSVGMGLTLIGLVLFSQAGSYSVLLLAAALVGTGSSVFHPESSRVARMASGGDMAWRNRCFRWVEMLDRPLAHCLPLLSYSAEDRAAWPGLLELPFWEYIF